MAVKGGLARLADVYSMMERMRSLERRVAAQAVDEAECAAALQAVARESMRAGARDALAAGDREEFQIAELAGEAVEARLARLAQVREQRLAALARAAVSHRESMVRMEQMDRLLERVRAAEAVEMGRREQAVADDRFGSRMAWVRTSSTSNGRTV